MLLNAEDPWGQEDPYAHIITVNACRQASIPPHPQHNSHMRPTEQKVPAGEYKAQSVDQ